MTREDDDSPITQGIDLGLFSRKINLSWKVFRYIIEDRRLNEYDSSTTSSDFLEKQPNLSLDLQICRLESGDELKFVIKTPNKSYKFKCSSLIQKKKNMETIMKLCSPTLMSIPVSPSIRDDDKDSLRRKRFMETRSLSSNFHSSGLSSSSTPSFRSASHLPLPIQLPARTSIEFVENSSSPTTSPMFSPIPSPVPSSPIVGYQDLLLTKTPMILNDEDDKNLLENLPEIETFLTAAMVGSLMGKIVEVNNMALELFGYSSKEELIGERINVLMNEKDSREHDGHLFRYEKRGSQGHLGKRRQVEIIKKDGTTSTINLVLALLPLEGYFVVSFF